VVPIKVYAGVFLALIALTITTVAISKIELGEYNFIVAMTIAVIKGSLVVWFFMHVRQASSLTKLCRRGIFLDGDYVRLHSERLFQPRMAAARRLVGS